MVCKSVVLSSTRTMGCGDDIERTIYQIQNWGGLPENALSAPRRSNLGLGIVVLGVIAAVEAGVAYFILRRNASSSSRASGSAGTISFYRYHTQ